MANQFTLPVTVTKPGTTTAQACTLLCDTGAEQYNWIDPTLARKLGLNITDITLDAEFSSRLCNCTCKPTQQTTCYIHFDEYNFAITPTLLILPMADAAGRPPIILGDQTCREFELIDFITGKRKATNFPRTSKKPKW